MRAILDICNLIFLCRALNKGVSIFPQWLAGVSCIFHHQAIVRVGCWYPDFFCLKVSILLPSGIARFNTFFTDYVTTGKHQGMYTLDSTDGVFEKIHVASSKSMKRIIPFGLCAMLTCFFDNNSNRRIAFVLEQWRHRFGTRLNCRCRNADICSPINISLVSI